MSAGKFYFASSKDVNNVREYLVAQSEKDIEDYCMGRHIDQPDLFYKEKEIVAWYTNPTPIMVAHHFKWVGKRRNPFVIAIPFEYGVPIEKQKWTIEKW